MQTQRIELGLLRASAQPRPLQTADVDKLAASIREIGLIQPVTVRAAIINGNVAKDGFQIVAGHHRVAAARALGWTEIDAIVVQAEGHLEAELIEIDENLVRSELSVAQRAHYTARRKEVWEALHPEPTRDYGLESYDGEGDEMDATNCRIHLETDAMGRKKSPQQTKGFAASTAEVTGENVRQIQRNLARAEAIGDAPTRSKGTPAVFQSRVECRRGEGQFFSLPWVVVSTPQDRGQLRSEKRPQPRWRRHQVGGGGGEIRRGGKRTLNDRSTDAAWCSAWCSDGPAKS